MVKDADEAVKTDAGESETAVVIIINLIYKKKFNFFSYYTKKKNYRD